ncbi:tRNA (adenine(22)-N(1))-methyltransferase [Anaeromicropila herbilytica]|uniref:SAM-dependent methyltransferase n=1 Tax=Anaeromicropila herbilytica TaxID=2785025 RepID=A0A7R7IEL6_9FIRM|nr:class I SAM-dependent methyltransferase [Anaeromicropila herbilytica]BCN32239.1 SAM-dependent methyltransferase [Anaeromicropila herbilytica]
MQLSKRLQAVADLVTVGNRVADIGCDHAYTSIYLMENHIASHIIAMDINKGPLERANENIEKTGFKDRIETRLSDGAAKLKEDEVDTILIAGMGGSLMVKILSDSESVVSMVNEFILQPQSEIFLVRKYLHEIGCDIQYETMFIDEGKYYVVIKATRDTKNMIANPSDEEDKKRHYDPKRLPKKYDKEVHYLYGKLLLENKNRILEEFLEKEYHTTSNILNHLTEKETEHAKERVEELKQKLQYIIEGMNYYDKM